MAKTYADFKAHLQTFLWRLGDQQLANSMDALVDMADADLRTELNVLERDGSALITTSLSRVALPADYHAMRGVSDARDNPYLGELTYVSPSSLQAAYSHLYTGIWRDKYSIEDKTLLLAGPNSGLPEDEITLLVEYRNDIPDFETDDTSWVAEKYLNVYTYAALKHASVFAREDTRVPNFDGLYTKALSLAVEDTEFNRRRGVSSSKPLSRQAGITRRRRV